MDVCAYSSGGDTNMGRYSGDTYFRIMPILEVNENKPTYFSVLDTGHVVWNLNVSTEDIKRDLGLD